jgi:hypothetical protein
MIHIIVTKKKKKKKKNPFLVEPDINGGEPNITLTSSNKQHPNNPKNNE